MKIADLDPTYLLSSSAVMGDDSLSLQDHSALPQMYQSKPKGVSGWYRGGGFVFRVWKCWCKSLSRFFLHPFSSPLILSGASA